MDVILELMIAQTLDEVRTVLIEEEKIPLNDQCSWEGFYGDELRFPQTGLIRPDIGAYSSGWHEAERHLRADESLLFRESSVPRIP